MSDEIIETKECRICFEEEIDESDPLIAPCLCDGTSKYIHLSCLNNWRHFNRDTRAWTHCMECNGEYTIINDFPLESTQHYKILSKKINIFIQNYMFNFFSSYLVYYIDHINNYNLIHFLNLGLNTPEPSLISLIKNESLAPQVFYFSFTIFISNIILYIYFYYVISCKIYRKKEYLKQIRLTYFSCIFYSFLFLIFYYILNFTGNTLIYFNIITLLSICEPYIIYKLIKKHNETIMFLNNNTNETIVSYENRNNPVYNIEMTEENQVVESSTDEQINNIDSDSDSEIEIEIFLD